MLGHSPTSTSAWTAVVALVTEWFDGVTSMKENVKPWVHSVSGVASFLEA